MTNTHTKRIAFHLESLLATIDIRNPGPTAAAVASAVATAYHDANATPAQRVAFALAMLAGASAALQQVEAESGGLADDALKAGKGIEAGSLLNIRKAAEICDADIETIRRHYRLIANYNILLD
jgi:hypothetical protein